VLLISFDVIVILCNSAC